MKYINKIRLHNFKRFTEFSVDLDKELNIIIGDNESGKSTILTAINLVLSGNLNKIDTLGLEYLFNSQVVQTFLESEKDYNDLPILFIELFLNEQHDFRLNGKNNSDERICDGLRLECVPNDDFSEDIIEILKQKNPVFPFEYYITRFLTFSGDPYSGYKKYLRHISIDSSQVSSEYAIKEYVKDMYNNHIQPIEKSKHQNEYRRYKELFKDRVLNDLNSRLENYSFTVKNNSKANLETDLTLCENDIYLENQGRGRQCIIKTEFALSKQSENNDIILLEEPENHLSHINMKKVIRKIRESSKRQLFIATHSNMVSTRLGLRKSILLNSNSTVPVLMKTISESTAKYFMKAPDNNVLDFILSKKVILVEGDSEFILMEAFFNKITDENLEISDIHVISVDGTSFKRFLEIAVYLKIKTAVIRDNDGDYQGNCIDSFMEFSENEFIKVFSDNDNTRSTFEICLYQDNSEFCEKMFGKKRKILSVLNYMIKNKTGVAFELLENYANEIVVPKYISRAIRWIRE